MKALEQGARAKIVCVCALQPIDCSSEQQAAKGVNIGFGCARDNRVTYCFINNAKKGGAENVSKKETITHGR